MEFLTGFEGTQIFGSGRDVLDTTEHATRFDADFARLAADGIKRFRACIPWHKIEAVPSSFDWRWCDAYLAAARHWGLTPIADLLHHTSWPEWLTGGMADDRFAPAFTRFTEAFAQRYPWVQQYNVINEPFVTAWFCGHAGIWHPHHHGWEAFARVALNVAKAIVGATAAIKVHVEGAVFIHTDACERHTALDWQSQGHADWSNEVRFCILDLVLGRLNRDHPLRSSFGNEAALDRLEANPARVDVLGLDYYSHSEIAWDVNGRAGEHPVDGFAAVAADYDARYGLPMMLGETNIRGTVDDRMAWLRYMVLEAEKLPDLQGFCWYPYIDSTDWDSLVREANGLIDPQGIYWLSGDLERNASQLSSTYAALAQGEITGRQIAVRPYHPAVIHGRGIKNYLRDDVGQARAA